MTPYPKRRLTGPEQEHTAPAPRRRATRRVPTRLLTAGLWLVVAAVVLWGLQYRLSLYRPHRNPAARASAVKLWVEPRSHRDAFAARTPVNQPNHDFPVSLAGTVRQGGHREFPFHWFVISAYRIDVRIASVSPRSPPRINGIATRCLAGS